MVNAGFTYNGKEKENYYYKHEIQLKLYLCEWKIWEEYFLFSLYLI